MPNLPKRIHNSQRPRAGVVCRLYLHTKSTGRVYIYSEHSATVVSRSAPFLPASVCAPSLGNARARCNNLTPPASSHDNPSRVGCRPWPRVCFGPQPHPPRSARTTLESSQTLRPRQRRPSETWRGSPHPCSPARRRQGHRGR